MNDEHLKEIASKLDKILAILAIQSMPDKNDKIYTLKKFGLTSEEISLLVAVQNPRQTEGWKRKLKIRKSQIKRF